MLTCLRVPRHIKICSSMRPTKWDQAQVNWTLRSGVRAKKEGKFVFFCCDKDHKILHITLIISQTKRDECFHCRGHFLWWYWGQESVNLKFKLPSLSLLLPYMFCKSARRARIFQAAAHNEGNWEFFLWSKLEFRVPNHYTSVLLHFISKMWLIWG